MDDGAKMFFIFMIVVVVGMTATGLWASERSYQNEQERIYNCRVED